MMKEGQSRRWWLGPIFASGAALSFLLTHAVASGGGLGGPGLTGSGASGGGPVNASTGVFSGALLTTASLRTTAGQKLTFDGATEAKYVSSDGTTLGLTGLNMSVASNNKLCMDSGTCTTYATWDGSNWLFYRSGAQQFYLNGQLNLVVVGDFKAGIGNSTASTPLTINDAEGLALTPKSLATCSASLEWTIVSDVLSGVATGKRSKLCLCTSDGASAYKWQNVVTGTLGTTTTCGTE